MVVCRIAQLDVFKLRIFDYFRRRTMTPVSFLFSTVLQLVKHLAVGRTGRRLGVKRHADSQQGACSRLGLSLVSMGGQPRFGALIWGVPMSRFVTHCLVLVKRLHRKRVIVALATKRLRYPQSGGPLDGLAHLLRRDGRSKIVRVGGRTANHVKTCGPRRSDCRGL